MNVSQLPLALTVSVALSSGVTTAAQASLIGTELRIGTINQVSLTSEIFYTDFPASSIVSAGVEFPSAESLFGDFPRPPGSFIVDTSIDAGLDYIEIGFSNAGSGTFASWYQNTYVFGFSTDALVTITGASVDRDVSNLGISEDNVYFDGGDLFVNVSGLRFNTGSFLRVDLASRIDPEQPAPVPVPAALPLLGIGIGTLGLLRRKRRKT